jgi:anti-sigma factor ChrR (cupin superfamily)
MSHEKALNNLWAGVLAEEIAPAHRLSNEASERIKQQLMARVSGSAAQTQPVVRNVRRDEGWVHLSKRVQAKVLHDNGQTLSWLLKLLPGGRLAEHDHADGAEECMVLEGQLRINGEDFWAGDYQIALPGSVHHDVSSESGSLVYLRSPSSRRQDLMGA